jgi:hypothetical protein
MNRPQSPSPIAGEASALPHYEQDFDLWLRAQARLLRERKFELLDVDNLVEEVESMGGSLHRELKSRLSVILLHLLKLQFQPGHRSNNWLGTLAEQHSEIELLLEQSPSLARHVAEYAQRGYRHAVRKAALETGLAAASFPTTNPYSEAQLLDPDFYP